MVSSYLKLMVSSYLTLTTKLMDFLFRILPSCIKLFVGLYDNFQPAFVYDTIDLVDLIKRVINKLEGYQE